MLKIQSKIEDVFKKLPVLETERLKLRPVCPRDSNDIYEYASEPEVAKYVTWEHHRTIADSIHFLRLVMQQYKEGLPSPWGIIYKENNKLIGTAGYHRWVPGHSKAEFGYALSIDYWNKGIMTEAMKEILRFGFEELGLNRAEARCFIDNVSSERVMQKLGMKYEGILRQTVFIKDEFRDLKVYSLLRSEFLKNNQGYNS
jgi:ribosomal-protein-alanine N-acetyltransferase